MRHVFAIIHGIIIFSARYGDDLRDIPSVRRECQGRRFCRQNGVEGEADGHGRVVAGLAFQRNRISDVATFIYSQGGIREGQDGRNDVAVAAGAAASIGVVGVVVILIVVVVVAAVFAIAP